MRLFPFLSYWLWVEPVAPPLAGPLVERKKDGKSGKSKTKKQRGAYERKNATVGLFGTVEL